MIVLRWGSMNELQHEAKHQRRQAQNFVRLFFYMAPRVAGDVVLNASGGRRAHGLWFGPDAHVRPLSDIRVESHKDGN
jgi:hypothetical protein